MMALLQDSLNSFNNESVLLCFLCIEQVLLLTASSSTITLGHRLSLKLLTDCIPCLYTSLSMDRPRELSAATLRVLTAIVMQGRATARELLDVFDLSSTIIQQVSKDSSKIVRCCYIKFLLSFIILGDTGIATRLLSIKKLFQPVFRHLVKDEPDVIELVLTVLSKEVVMNKSIGKSLKLELFNKYVLEDLSKVLVDPSHADCPIPNLMIDFLTSLCTNTKTGITFISKTFIDNPDWTNNPTVLHMLIHLLPELHRHNIVSMMVKIISSSPDLLVVLMKKALFSYDLKKNSNWDDIMDFTIQVFSGLPTVVDLLTQCDQQHINQSNMSSCIQYSIPHGINRSNLSSLLLKDNNNVRRRTVKLSLVILLRVLDTRPVVSEDNGFQSLFFDSVLKQLPDVQTILNVKQSLLKDENSSVNASYSLLSDIHEVLYLLQCISPVILSRCNVNMANLINDVSHLPTSCDEVDSIKDHVLSIVSEATIDSITTIITSDVLKKLIVMMLESLKFPNRASAILVKCRLINPLLVDKEADLVLFLESLYTWNSRDYSIDIKLLTRILIKMYRFDIGRKDCGCKEKLTQSVLCEFAECDSMDYDLFGILCSSCASAEVSPLANCILKVMNQQISDVDFSFYLKFLFKLVLSYNKPVKLSSSLWTLHSTSVNQEESQLPDLTKFEDYCSHLNDNSSVDQFSPALVQVNLLLLSISSKELSESHLQILCDFFEASSTINRFNQFLRVLAEFVPSSVLLVYLLSNGFNNIDKEGASITTDNDIIQAIVSIADKLTQDSSVDLSSLFLPSHYQLFLGSYSATTTSSDRGLLYLMYLYEKSGISMAKYNPVIWGSRAIPHYSSKQETNWLLWKQPTTLEILNCFDKVIMKRSVEHFPLTVALEPINPWVDEMKDDDPVVVYDPCFVLPRLSLLLAPFSLCDCRKFVSCYCLSYVLAGTSSLNESVRCASYHCLHWFQQQLHKTATLRSKKQLSMFMAVLKNSIVKENIRLPGIVSSFFINILPILTNKDHSLYSVINSFLSKRTHLNIRDIPLYSVFLHSSASQYVLERQWMLQLLVKGLQCNSDYFIYKNKQVFEDVMSLYHCPFTPNTNKNIILQLITRAVSFVPAARDLVWNHGLLPWLHDLQCRNEHIDLVQHILDVVDKTVESKKSSSLASIPLYNDELNIVLT